MRLKLTTLAIDFDGVVFRGDTPIAGVPAALEKLRGSGMRLFFLTNNSSKTRADYAKKLAGMGIRATPEQIFTSAYGAALYLSSKHPGKRLKVFPVGEDGLRSELAAAGFEVADSVGWGGDDVDYVVSGIDRKFDYAKLHSAQNAILNGARFIACNTDPTWPVERGFIPGSGSLVAAITACTNNTAPEIIIGKPNTYLLSLIQKQARCKKPELALIDDRLDTGVAVANKFGIYSILVLTGATGKKEALAARGILKPKKILDSLAELPAFLTASSPE